MKGMYEVDGNCYFKLETAIDDAKELARLTGKWVNIINVFDRSIVKSISPE